MLLSMLRISKSQEISNERTRTSKSSLNIGLLLILFLTTILLISSFSLILGINFGKYNLPISLSIVLVIYFFFLSEKKIKPILIETGIFLLVISLSIAVSSFFYDRSFDGQAYHQEAIIQLENSWNPYYEQLGEDTKHATWLNHYAKGPWIIAAQFYKFTSQIESGKSINLLYIAASWFFFVSLLTSIKAIPTLWGITIATAAALNPVSVYQALSFYVDGQVSSIFASIVALLTIAVLKPSKPALVGATLLILTLANVKFTGLAYAIIIVGAYGIICIAIRNLNESIGHTVILGTGLIAGITIIGFNPYLTNTYNNGHIFYPLRGENPIDVVSHTKPHPFKPMSQIESLSVSIFSASSNSKNEYELKAPFHLPKGSELWALSGVDPRIGGFGPWFSGILILSLLGLLAIFFKDGNRKTFFITLYLASAIVATVLINPESWWARYIPQLYLLPLLICIVALGCQSKLMNLLSGALVTSMLLNTAMIGYPSLKRSLGDNSNISDQLSSIREAGSEITIDLSVFHALRTRLDEANINYVLARSESDLECDTPTALIATNGRAKFCSNTESIR